MRVEGRERSRGRLRTLVVAGVALVWIFLAACSARSNPPVETIMVAPQSWIREAGGTVRVAVPLHTRDERYRYLVPTIEGRFTIETADETLFPTMVLLVDPSDDVAPAAFLARSPHGSCLVEWSQEQQRFLDPCSGSRWDRTGKYVEGPSPRDLDHLPVEVRDGMLWVTNEITYGQSMAFDNP